MNRKRIKIVIASLILAAAMAFLVVAGVKKHKHETLHA